MTKCINWSWLSDSKTKLVVSQLRLIRFTFISQKNLLSCNIAYILNIHLKNSWYGTHYMLSRQMLIQFISIQSNQHNLGYHIYKGSVFAIKIVKTNVHNWVLVKNILCYICMQTSF